MTIYDIAEKAGVAASTVSRVINNKPGIKPSTRAKVQKLLKEFNYTPNETARGLVMQSTKIIGILIVDIRVTHHIESAYVIEQEMTKLGYCCITMSTGPSDEKKAEYIKILEQRRVEGAILMGSMFETEAVQKSIQKYLPHIPVVIVNGYLNLPNVSGVLVDEDAGIERCVDLLWNKEKKKIAFIMDSYSPANSRKYLGYLKGMERHGIARADTWYYETEESSVEGGYKTTELMIREHPDIQGIIYTIDLIAVGGIRAAHDLGLIVPDQLALIGVDCSLYGEICMPKLTTLDNKLEELSEAAASILMEGLEGKMKSRKIMMFSNIVEREST